MRFCYTFFFILVFTANSAFAEFKPALMEGMSYYDVLNRWGPPKEKVIYESKREANWLYKKDSVRFKEGKLVTVAAIIDPWDIKSKELVEKKAAQAKKRKEEQDDSEELLEIFEEISASYPEENGNVSPPPGSPIKNKARP